MPLIHLLLLIIFIQGQPGGSPRTPQQGHALDPDDITARQYAFSLTESGKFCEAIRPLRKLKATGAMDLAVRAVLIESLFKCGKQQEGEEELREFYSSATVTPEEQVNLAKALAEDHLPDAAQEVLEHVVATSPDLAEAHDRLGALLFSRHQYELAVSHLGRAVQLDPTSAFFSMHLAEALLRGKQYGTALDFLSAVKDRFGNLPDYQYKVAWAHYGKRQVAEAATELEGLIRQYRNLDLPHYSLGDCYIMLGRLGEAEQQYQSAIRLNPQKASYYDALAQVLRKEGKGRLDEAIISLEKALRLNPSDTQGQVQLALCYEQKGDLRKAQQYLEAAIRLQPDLLDAHRVLARVYYRQGNTP